MVETVHATCVALGDHAVLLTGRSGAGKSDLALRLVDRGWDLVSDDYTRLTPVADALIASAPPTIAGQIEIRGIGIVAMPCRTDLPVALLCDLDAAVDRLPESRFGTIAGRAVACIAVAGLEASAPIKVEQALKRVIAA